MKTLALIICTLALALLFLNHPAKPLARTEALDESASPAQSKSPEPTSTPFVARAPSAKWSDQRIAQGRVVGINQDGIVLMCERLAGYYEPGNTVDARSGAGDIKAAAEWAIKIEQQKAKEQYGPLLAFCNGVLTKPFSVPDKMADGTVLLVNFPPDYHVSAGSRMRVIAAPTGDNRENRAVYSVKF